MTERLTITLCGSTRFSKAFQEANLALTLQGHLVFTIGCDMKDDFKIFKHLSSEDLEIVKDDLDALHRAKIDASDGIFVLNVMGYIGASTAAEIEYAHSQGKWVKYLYPFEATPNRG